MNSAYYYFLIRWVICKYFSILRVFFVVVHTHLNSNPYLSVVAFIAHAFGVTSDFFSPMTMSWFVSPMLPHGSFTVSGLTFETLVYFELFSVCGDNQESSFNDLQISTSVDKHPLLKRLSFCQCILLIPFSKIYWLTCGMPPCELAVRSPRSTKQHKLLPTISRRQDPIAEDTVKSRTLRNQTGTDLKFSFLPARLHGDRKNYVDPGDKKTSKVLSSGEPWILQYWTSGKMCNNDMKVMRQLTTFWLHLRFAPQ